MRSVTRKESVDQCHASLPVWVAGTCTDEQAGHTWYQVMSNYWYLGNQVRLWRRKHGMVRP